MNRELPDVQAGFRKGKGTRDQIANIQWIIEKSRDETIRPPYCLLRNLCAGQETIVKVLHGTMDWFKIVKAVHQAIFCQPAYLN